jgi:hypothetical protein
MPDGTGDHQRPEQDRQERDHAQPLETEGALGWALAGEIAHELLELANGLGLIAAVQPLLELLCVEPALGVAGTKPVGDRLAVGVARADVCIASEDACDVLVHVPSDRIVLLKGIVAPASLLVIGRQAAFCLLSAEVRHDGEYSGRRSPACFPERMTHRSGGAMVPV